MSNRTFGAAVIEPRCSSRGASARPENPEPLGCTNSLSTSQLAFCTLNSSRMVNRQPSPSGTSSHTPSMWENPGSSDMKAKRRYSGLRNVPSSLILNGSVASTNQKGTVGRRQILASLPSKSSEGNQPTADHPGQQDGQVTPNGRQIRALNHDAAKRAGKISEWKDFGHGP